LIGATTENPSFEVNSALLSRSKVYVLQPLSLEQVVLILRRALADTERGLGGLHIDASDEALTSLARYANGDARVALNLLEQVSATLTPTAEDTRPLDVSVLADLIERRALLYDKAGDEHFNIISALHKSIRNSDADAGLYWLARMLEAGEDPMYIARRLVRFASEDIGNADPRALQLAIAAKDATHFLGMPECNTALAQLVTYLSAAPKSNAVYVAYGLAAKDALRDEAAPVPLHIRNAPTKLMKDLGFGKDYKYAHDEPDAVTDMSCLPDGLAHKRYYEPTERGLEPKLREALERARQRRQKS
jgi:putative ATPase